MSSSAQLETDAWLEDFVTGIVERAGFDLEVTELSDDARIDALVLQLDGPDKALAIGRDGQVLEALQTLVLAAAANAGLAAGGRRIVVDVDHFRARRDEHLCEEARRLAEEVLATGQPADLEPMAPRERRLVHMTVAGIEGVVTESAGQGDGRFVRLVPDHPQP
jgi:spoIIIJ-associated protein